jgi:transposase
VQLRTAPPAVEEKRLRLKNKRRERAAQLLAEDLRSDLKISELCGIHIATLYKWKKRPEIVERIAELTQIYADKALKTGLAQRDKRVAVLRQMHDKLLPILEERAADLD